MGCGGSKSEVASGNTITTRLLRKKPSVTEEKKETAKLVSRDSSEQYFSSRKDSIDADVAAGGFHTPLVELLPEPNGGKDVGDGKRDKIEELEASADDQKKGDGPKEHHTREGEQKMADVKDGNGDLEDGKVPIDSTKIVV